MTCGVGAGKRAALSLEIRRRSATRADDMSKVSASDMKKPHHAFAKEGRKRAEDAGQASDLLVAVKPHKDLGLKH